MILICNLVSIDLFFFSLKLTSSSIDPGLNIKQLGGLYINFNVDKLQPHKETLTQIKEKKKNEVSYMNCPSLSPWEMTAFPKVKLHWCFLAKDQPCLGEGF